MPTGATCSSSSSQPPAYSAASLLGNEFARDLGPACFTCSEAQAPPPQIRASLQRQLLAQPAVEKEVVLTQHFRFTPSSSPGFHPCPWI